MAKCTAVIDIGSNSMRMAVFEKTSRFAFHILHEVKSGVRLSEHAYTHEGHLQPQAMERTSQALGEFLRIAQGFKARKIICVATSALRDAPNNTEFLRTIRQKHNLAIRIISGEEEAYFGGIACANLLPYHERAISLDVGGGSSELAVIHQGSIEHTYSLKLGTVRIKELFLDHDDIDGAIHYIDAILATLPPLRAGVMIGIGGSFRALSRAMMKKENYPLKKLHGFEMKADAFGRLSDDVLKATPKKLKSLGIKTERLDTIKAGTLIITRILHHLNPTHLISSGSGVREGVFLHDMLRHHHDRLPHHFNPSVRYLLDTHVAYQEHGIRCAHIAKRLFDLVRTDWELPSSYRGDLSIAAKLLSMGITVRYYGYQKHSYYLALNHLDYRLTHAQIALISHLLLFKKAQSLSDLVDKSFGPLLPSKEILDLLHTLLWLAHTLLIAHDEELEISYTSKTLTIRAEHLYLSREQLKNIALPKRLRVEVI